MRSPRWNAPSRHEAFADALLAAEFGQESPPGRSPVCDPGRRVQAVSRDQSPPPGEVAHALARVAPEPPQRPSSVGWKPVEPGNVASPTSPSRASKRQVEIAERETLKASLMRWGALFVVILLIALSLVTLLDRSVSSHREVFFSYSVVSPLSGIGEEG